MNTLSDLSNGVGYSARNYFFKNFKKNGEYFNVDRDRYDTFEQIRYLTNNLRSVKVLSSYFDKETLKKLARSFLYEINSSYGEAFTTVEVSTFDLFRSNQHYGPIRKRYDEISAPVKVYDEEILSYYQRAISTNNIEFQFLSFYQILEYFYDKYFSDSMSLELLNKHNESPFEFDSDSSRLELIETIIMKYRRLNEKESLKSVLRENITSKADFKNELNAADNTLLKYWNNPWPGFLNFEPFDYDSLSLEEIVKLLSERIYAIRNEVTHRKSKRTKYLPQKHERYLLHETRLLQVIVELIIDSNGKEYVSQK